MDISICERSKNIEANLVGCFWNNPQLFFDYIDLTVDYFNNAVWKFYFSLGKKLALKDIKKIDEVSVELFLQNKDKLLEAYKGYGGFEVINTLKQFVVEDNIEVYINELKKWKTIKEMKNTFVFSDKDIKKIESLSLDQIYRFYEAQLNNIFVNTVDDVETSKLNEDIDKIIDEANLGLNKGMPFYNCDILNNEIGGWINGQVYIAGGLSGAGKTTITQEIVLAAVWELNEPCVIMLNEQDSVKWKQQFITWIINNKVLVNTGKRFNAKRWRQGKFSNEEFKWLKAATDMLQHQVISNKIIFVHFKSYSQKRAERVIKKYSSLGIKKFVLDTFKLSSDREDEAFWLSMQEDMRKFDDLVKPSNLNVGLWCTLQLQKGSRLLRYLTADNIGMAKNTIDVASVSLLIRRLWNDEYPSGNRRIDVKMPIEGTSSYREVILDETKKYVIIFIEKNRNGESQTFQIVAEQDLGTLNFKEVGICDIPIS